MSHETVPCALCGTPRTIRHESVWLDGYLTVYCSQACLMSAERDGLQQALHEDAMCQREAVQAQVRRKA